MKNSRAKRLFFCYDLTTMVRTVSNADIAQKLYEMAMLYEMEDVAFKPRAYEKVAANIAALDREVAGIYKEGGVEALRREIPNVGEGIAHHLEEILKTGTFGELEKYKKKIPVRLDEFIGIQGLGPKHIKTLYLKLKVRTLKDLERVACAGKIAKLSGFGKKSEENILRSIAFSKKYVGRFLLGAVDALVRVIEERLRRVPGVGHVTTAGSYRRRQETIGDIDILVTAKNAKRVMETFVSMPEVSRVLAHGPTKAMVRLKSGIQADVRVVPEKSYGAALQYFTGDKTHNVELRKIAIKKGLKLNEYGVFRKLETGNWKMIAGGTEEEVYKALGLRWMEPELRTASGEIEAARTNKLPKLIPYGSLRGDLQMQSNWTDGNNSIAEMARSAAEAGLEYIAITDHTKGLAMTDGLDEKRLLQQGKEIDRVNEELRIKNVECRVLKSTECNILKDGKLDLADSALKTLDLVGVAVHSHFNLSEREQTERIIRAMKNPLVNILFHPTGRKIGKREPYAVDISKIIRAAKQYGVALEINAAPERLDLKDLHIREAVEAGTKLVIDSDAHATAHFKWLDFGVAQARRGWATSRDVLNTLPCEEFLKTLKGLKKKQNTRNTLTPPFSVVY
ncbi:DNA polymerase/3'-5' exonuclease PolX [Candidatus Uhrbacteria bacterium]|nr:DNA polymerase/3'-5' exonuclease PolX [Candidatus Uhrbacteria bacterium]